MKSFKRLLILVSFSWSAFAQGTILFSNNNIPNADGNGVYRAGIYRYDDDFPRNLVGVGAGYTAGLFLASNLTTPLATTTFRINNNFEVFADNSQEVAIPGHAPGTVAQLVVRVWTTASGSYENARLFGQPTGEQAFTSRILGGQNPIPGEPAFFTPGMTGFTGFVVPEPSVLALAAVGFGALLLVRRNQNCPGAKPKIGLCPNRCEATS